MDSKLQLEESDFLVDAPRKPTTATSPAMMNHQPEVDDQGDGRPKTSGLPWITYEGVRDLVGSRLFTKGAELQEKKMVHRAGCTGQFDLDVVIL